MKTVNERRNHIGYGNSDQPFKVNELRVGNYIVFKEFGEGDGKISQMKRGDFGRFNDEEYHPIPLTPEWLERCGFEVIVHEKGIPYIVVNSFMWLIVIDGAVPHLVLASAELMHDLQTRVQYIHQLQNLYFALTGEELNVTL